MKKTITLLFTLISLVSNAQKIKKILSFEPDSIVYYADSLQTERYMVMKNLYSEDSVVLMLNWYDSDTVNYSRKYVYYMDRNVPELSVESLDGFQNTLYVYHSSIGDTLTVAYDYDFSSDSWVLHSKTKHNITASGIDTMSTTHIWNEELAVWELNNVVKKEYIDSDTDTLKAIMLASNLIDTVDYFILTNRYNQEGEVSVAKEFDVQSDGTLRENYLIDSITYNSSGLVDFIYRGTNFDCDFDQQPDCKPKYDYAEQYMYDAQGRFDKIYFWDKQGLPEWTFDGSYQFYYTIQPSKIKERNFDSLCNVYPNPCDASLVIESYTGIIEMFNSSGQLVISEQFENGGRINTSSLRKGVYILKFGDVYSTVIIKQ